MIQTQILKSRKTSVICQEISVRKCQEDTYRHAKTIKLYLPGTFPQEANRRHIPAKWGCKPEKGRQGD